MFLTLLSTLLCAAPLDVKTTVDAVSPVYRQLHAAPELSGQASPGDGGGGPRGDGQ